MKSAVIIIKWSRTFWEVRPPTKRAMKILSEYIKALKETP